MNNLKSITISSSAGVSFFFFFCFSSSELVHYRHLLE